MVQRLAIQAATAADDLAGTELIPARQWNGTQWVSVYLTPAQIALFIETEGATITIGDIVGLQDALNAKVSIESTTLAALLDVTNAVNTSGKLLTAWRYDENFTLWRPLGILANSVWRALHDPAGIEDKTPV